MKSLIRINILLFYIFFFQTCSAQSQAEKTGLVINEAFDKKISNTIAHTIPFIGVEELKNIQNEVIIFDAREKAEFDISHIPGAKFLGYKKFNPKQLKDVEKDKKIILYCSIGYRSEKIGEKLRKLGYSKIYNLYGSIFEWANRGYPLINYKGNKVQKVHTFNYSWSKWINNEHIEKVW